MIPPTDFALGQCEVISPNTSPWARILKTVLVDRSGLNIVNKCVGYLVTRVWNGMVGYSPSIPNACFARSKAFSESMMYADTKISSS